MSNHPSFYKTDYPMIHRWMVTGSHFTTWFLGKHWPRAFPLVYVTGFPKSGTVWVSRMIADYFQIPFPHFSVFPIGCHAVVHGHQPIPRTDARGAYVIRDGRDAMVSLYFKMARSLSKPHHARRQRQYFKDFHAADQVRENLPRFLERNFKKPFAARGMHWGQHVEMFLAQSYPTFAAVRYEALLDDAEKAFAEVVEKISEEPSQPDRIRATVWKFSFEQQAGRKQGSENRDSFLRKGTAGDWRRYFTRESGDIFDRYCGETLISAGYEENRSWLDLLDNEPSGMSAAA